MKTKNLLQYKFIPAFFPGSKLVASKPWEESLNKLDETGLPGKNSTIPEIIIRVMEILLLSLGSFAIIGFVVSGIIYLTAAGNQERMEMAKRAMYYSIIGVIVGMGGYFVVMAVQRLYEGNKSTPPRYSV
ncbi:MAG: hypothetical protein GF332_00215 [Candidatus Moranbacteria bacterium]|nr:hypothetical protein [Candidatus Moranbacteria bacterium]